MKVKMVKKYSPVERLMPDKIDLKVQLNSHYFILIDYIIDCI